MNESYVVSANGSHEVSFAAQNIFVQNNTGQWVYVTIGSQQTPDANSNDLAVPPFTQISQPVTPGTKFFGFAIGTAFLPTAATQGGQVLVTFDEHSQPAASANISTPGALFQGLYVFAEPVLANNASTIIVSAVAGKSIYVFLIKAFADPTVGGTNSLSFWHTTDPDIIYLNPATLTGVGTARMVSDELDAKPIGFHLPLGAALHVTNLGGGTRQPGIFVLYNYA